MWAFDGKVSEAPMGVWWSSTALNVWGLAAGVVCVSALRGRLLGKRWNCGRCSPAILLLGRSMCYLPAERRIYICSLVVGYYYSEAGGNRFKIILASLCILCLHRHFAFAHNVFADEPSWVRRCKLPQAELIEALREKYKEKAISLTLISNLRDLPTPSIILPDISQS